VTGIVLFVVFTFLYHKQILFALGEITNYTSDNYYYINWALDQPDVRGIQTIYYWLLRLPSSAYLIGVLLALFTVGIIIAAYHLLLQQIRARKQSVPGFLLWITAIICVFETSIFVPGIYAHFYSGAWKGLPFHSPTQLMMTCFALLSLVLFFQIHDASFTKPPIGRLLLFSVSLLVSAWAKPNFIMCFFPVMAVIIIQEFLSRQRETGISSGQSFSCRFKRFIILGATVIPSLVYFLFLNSHIYGQDEGVTILPGYLLVKYGNLLLTPLLGLAFPLFVLWVNRRRLASNFYYRTSWGIFLMGFLQYLFLVEKGSRMQHGNFGWGLCISVLVLFIVSGGVFLGNLYDAGFSNLRISKRVYGILGCILIGLHLLSGVIYFGIVLTGVTYWI
jgi:hypothetical protein